MWLDLNLVELTGFPLSSTSTHFTFSWLSDLFRERTKKPEFIDDPYETLGGTLFPSSARLLWSWLQTEDKRAARSLPTAHITFFFAFAAFRWLRTRVEHKSDKTSTLPHLRSPCRGGGWGLSCRAEKPRTHLAAIKRHVCITAPDRRGCSAFRAELRGGSMNKHVACVCTCDAGGIRRIRPAGPRSDISMNTEQARGVLSCLPPSSAGDTASVHVIWYGYDDGSEIMWRVRAPHREEGKEVGTLSSLSLDTVQIPSSERGSEREILTRRWEVRGRRWGKRRGRSRRRLEGLKGRGEERKAGAGWVLLLN